MDDMLMAECGGDMDGAHMPALTADLVKPRSNRRHVRHAARICTGGCSCAARRAVLLATVLLLNALFTLTLSYAALYRPLERAIQVECGARADYHVLVYGGKLSDSAMARLGVALPEGMELMRGADGAVYGYASATSSWGCALSELRLRGMLGASARADRWVTAVGATRVQRQTQIPVERGWSVDATLVDRAGRLLEACFDAALTQYAGNGCASARGEGYHAAVRAGAELEYMLADGYLPVDY